MLSAGQPTNAAPADVFALRRFEWIPAFKSPRTVAPLVPRRFPVASVQLMDMAGGQLWAAVRSPAQTNVPGTSGRLWKLQDRTGLLEPVPGPLEQHSITALFGNSDILWLGLNGGLASLDLSRNVIHPFGPAQGVVSTNIVGIGSMDSTLVALGRMGLLWGMVPGTDSFVRASASAPASDPRAPEPWEWFATSGDWMLAVSTNSIAARHFRSPQWLPMRDELANGSPHLNPPRFTCVVGDGEGGFWVGSDAGLHWINPESNVVENRFCLPSVTVPGGLGMSVAPGFQPTAAAYGLARERVTQGIRDRMRDRARHARANARLQHPISPLLPTSRMPGGVTALHRDGRFLWVATQDGAHLLRSRVLLMHQPGRRWVGWFPVNAPIRCLATDAQHLWVGADVTRSSGVSPLFSVDRLALISAPQSQWIADAIAEEDLAERLAALPVKERAVLAFFGGQPAKVVELLAPTGDAAPGVDAESLFLLAFVNDAVGLHQPDALEHYVDRLRTEHPDSLFTELASVVRSARPAPLAPGETASTPEPPAPTAPPIPDTNESPAAIDTPTGSVVPTVTDRRTDAVLAKRDLGKDGRLNAVEFRLWRGPRADFKAADTNGDGQLDAGEIGQLLSSDPATAQ
ncbi:MAG: hypothetical protein RIS76_894 [Verrucomicrobiota bacterium]